MVKSTTIAVAVIFLAIGLAVGFLLPKPVETAMIQPQLVNVEEEFGKTFGGTFVGTAKYVGITSVPTGSIELFRFTEIPGHIHKNQNHFLYVLKGTASGFIGDVEGEVGPGTLVIIPAGVPHGFKSVGNESVDFILFSSPKFDATDTIQVENK